jgi:carbamoyl-phosphate synthase small subunit
MPGAIGAGATIGELETAVAATPSMEGRDLTRLVSTPEPYRVVPDGAVRGRVAALDFGMKRDILDALAGRGLEVDVMPAGTTAAEVLDRRPDGVFLSNGPGDPEPVTAGTATVRELLGRVPIFGICLGHQILGLALGASTYKLGFGHHGGNHPVRRLHDGRVSITAQNHGFAVDLWSLRPDGPPPPDGLPGPDRLPAAVETAFGTVVPTHQNLNDGTLEGMRAEDVAAFSVQYHPEAAPGPNDAADLFDDFLRLMEVE